MGCPGSGLHQVVSEWKGFGHEEFLSLKQVLKATLVDSMPDFRKKEKGENSLKQIELRATRCSLGTCMG